MQFFGFISDTPITAPLYIRDQRHLVTTVLTNFEAYGASSAVPEPRTMLLVGLGLVILPLIRRKRQRGLS